ncbi:predicted protein [Chaetoceros tenuissimus]|uniref:Uncharacterized protein n=1 Tax=Chaetoceros tenuissimus TaxID=426638 RepID=A0AAD3CL20_9STRA|nr:predicted protein [Chaetoceros tenuissimus]
MSDCGGCDDGGGCDYGGGYDGYGNEGGEHYYGSDHHHYQDRPYYSCQSSDSPMSDVVWGVLLLLVGGGVGGWLLTDSLQSQAVDADFVDLWLFPMVLLFVAILGVGLLMKGIQRITSKSKQSNFETSFNDTNQGGNDGDKNKFKMGDEETTTIASTTAGAEDSTIGKTNPYVVHAQQMEQQPSSNATQTDSDTKQASLFDQMRKWTSFNNANTTQNSNDFNRNQSRFSSKNTKQNKSDFNRNQSRQNEKKQKGAYFRFSMKFG